ncbi:MAG: response regulator transcription factor [Candidatus Promineifilaceae bacterium]|nr:response regulator transcription factor [Candidatus Promineifilaceae bacterium]
MSDAEIRILIADDHPVFRFGLRALLDAEPGLTVVGEAQDGEEAVRLAAAQQPDVVLMDINMPELNGIEATRQIVARWPDAAVLIISMLDDDSVFAALRAGARGYILKGAEPQETLQAIRSVARGEAIFSPGMAERVLAYFARPPAAAEPAEPFPELTPREREVLELIGQGYTNNAIAEQLVLSPKTVRNQVSTIYSKLQVAGRAEAIIKAREAGLDGSH